MRDLEKIAVDALKCAISWEPDACLIGNVTARETAYLASRSIMTCPKCGAEAFVNIDCNLCNAIEAIEKEVDSR